MSMRNITRPSTRSLPAAVYSQNGYPAAHQRRCNKRGSCRFYFQAVVNQTISGLACGKPIRGHVAFLGGPLHFLSELKTAFVRTLKLDDEHAIVPDNSHLFAAIGSAMNAEGKTEVSLLALKNGSKKK